MQSESILRQKLNEIKEMLDSEIYLKKYFSTLRDQIDYEMGEVELFHAFFYRKEKINQLWNDMINKVDIFEKECLANNLDEKLRNKFQKRIDMIEASFEYNKDVGLDGLDDSIEILKEDLGRAIFQNKTIIFANREKNENHLIGVNMDISKLLLINDQFISIQGVKRLLKKKIPFSKKLTNECIKLALFKKINAPDLILDISMEIDKVEKIDLSSKNFKCLAFGCFKNFAHLNYLNLSDNRLDQLETRVFAELINLRTLDLHNNQLSLSDRQIFSGLENLIRLDLSKNQIRFVDKEMFDGLRCIEFLNLAKNRIEHIENTMFRMFDQLKELYLEENKIIYIESITFEGLTHLKVLYLYKNSMKHLHENIFYGLTHLERLDLSENYLDSFPNESVFQDLISLQKLNLFQNNIKTIGRNMFKNLKKLSRLQLSNNEITTISNEAFSGLSSLETLLICANKIETIEAKAFYGLGMLRTLDLSLNSIKSLDANIFKDLTDLRTLELSDNKILLELFSYRAIRNLRKINEACVIYKRQPE